MKVLIACEESGIVREAFNKVGCDAYSCDIQDTSLPGKHIKDDVKNILSEKWDLMIAHPPCTRLCNSGVMWLHKRNLWNELLEAVKFFNILKNANIPKKCIENPIPHKYAVKYIGKYSQIIQPYMFGHGESKATCLWLHNLPLLKPTKLVKGRYQRLHRLPPTAERSKLRSKTYLGIAKAMAEQWGNSRKFGEEKGK